MSVDREYLLFPDVLASTLPGDIEMESTGQYFAQTVTNNQDTIVRTTVYWYLPEDGEPVLMIEIDDEDKPGGLDIMDVKVRIRRNDGLIYEGDRASQENFEERT